MGTYLPKSKSPNTPGHYLPRKTNYSTYRTHRYFQQALLLLSITRSWNTRKNVLKVLLSLYLTLRKEKLLLRTTEVTLA